MNRENDNKQLQPVGVDLNVLRNSLHRLYGATDVLLTKLNDDSGAIAVLPIDQHGVSNALIGERRWNREMLHSSAPRFSRWSWIF